MCAHVQGKKAPAAKKGKKKGSDSEEDEESESEGDFMDEGDDEYVEVRQTHKHTYTSHRVQLY